MKKPTAAAPAKPDPILVANIIGQFCFAFGQGAGSVHVMREAIRALRDRYAPCIAKATPGGDDSLWVQQAIHVLEYMRAVGRLAAHSVVVDGRTKITTDDFLKAAITVEIAARNDRPMTVLRGDWCPP